MFTASCCLLLSQSSFLVDLLFSIQSFRYSPSKKRKFLPFLFTVATVCQPWFFPPIYLRLYISAKQCWVVHKLTPNFCFGHRRVCKQNIGWLLNKIISLRVAVRTAKQSNVIEKLFAALPITLQSLHKSYHYFIFDRDEFPSNFFLAEGYNNFKAEWDDTHLVFNEEFTDFLVSLEALSVNMEYILSVLRNF